MLLPSLPRIKVDEAEFIRLMMEAGLSEADAKMQAKVAKGLGSDVKIGDKLVGIKK